MAALPRVCIARKPVSHPSPTLRTSAYNLPPPPRQVERVIEETAGEELRAPKPEALADEQLFFIDTVRNAAFFFAAAAAAAAFRRRRRGRRFLPLRRSLRMLTAHRSSARCPHTNTQKNNRPQRTRRARRRSGRAAPTPSRCGRS